MKEGKYYWLKLKDTFMTSDAVDFLMEQKNGSNYVVLYQMICLKTINTGGELARQIGELIIPYNVDKITRDCKWFDRDTVIVALELYKQLGLIYLQENGMLRIADFDNLVGSETKWAAKKRLTRANQEKRLTESADIEICENSQINMLPEPKPKKEKKPTAPKITYGQQGYVKLTEDEYNRLVGEFGEHKVRYYIDYVDFAAAKTHNKNKWKDWNLTIRGAIRDGWGKYQEATIPVYDYNGGSL